MTTNLVSYVFRLFTRSLGSVARSSQFRPFYLTIRYFKKILIFSFFLLFPLSNPASATSSVKQSFVPDERSPETPCTEAAAATAASAAATVSVSVQQQ